MSWQYLNILSSQHPAQKLPEPWTNYSYTSGPLIGPNETVRAILLTNVLQYGPALPREKLCGVYKVLKPQGIIRVTVPNLDVALEHYRANKLGPKSLSDFLGHHFFSLDKLRLDLFTAGFREVEVAQPNTSRCPEIQQFHRDHDPHLHIITEAVKW